MLVLANLRDILCRIQTLETRYVVTYESTSLVDTGNNWALRSMEETQGFKMSQVWPSYLFYRLHSLCLKMVYFRVNRCFGRRPRRPYGHPRILTPGLYPCVLLPIFRENLEETLNINKITFNQKLQSYYQLAQRGPRGSRAAAHGFCISGFKRLRVLPTRVSRTTGVTEVETFAIAAQEWLMTHNSIIKESRLIGAPQLPKGLLPKKYKKNQKVTRK